MSNDAVRWAYSVRSTTGPEKAVLAYLADRAAGDLRCWPSIRKIAEDTSHSVPTIKRVRKSLRDKGLLVFGPHPDRRNATMYSLAAHSSDIEQLSDGVREIPSWESRGGHCDTPRGSERSLGGVTVIPPREPSRTINEPSVTPPVVPLIAEQAVEPKPKPPPRKRGTHLPDDWEPDLACRAYAAERGFSAAEIDDIAADFHHHWTNGNGRNKKHLDWCRTWQTWIRREHRSPFAGKLRVNGNAVTSPGVSPDTAALLRGELWDEADELVNPMLPLRAEGLD